MLALPLILLVSSSAPVSLGAPRDVSALAPQAGSASHAAPWEAAALVAHAAPREGFASHATLRDASAPLVAYAAPQAGSTPAATSGTQAVLVPAPESRDVLLRRQVAQVALAQVRKQDPAWHPDQRDCAGLIRFAVRTAYKRIAPARLETPLWTDARGTPTDFADAETLVRRNMVLLGRDDATRESLRTGDVLAFLHEHDSGPVFHLMLVVRPEDRAHAPARVVYHPGEKGAQVRTGLLHNLADEAPREWRPVPSNNAFVGYFRLKEWMP
ncbi:DUF1175 family protein [Myxococcus sp. AS-1-15]|uniref:DUF1175 family protein n=1 Tax=Myxococcus sp. AS-1-15 TaxID=2874600 RepID=UPI001CBE09E5|nr:DUF1175 family protein [Myxococcus sp. AS-1-15]BDT30950.1 DUF1175 family protein [Myxococcus sp. MH1]